MLLRQSVHVTIDVDLAPKFQILVFLQFHLKKRYKNKCRILFVAKSIVARLVEFQSSKRSLCDNRKISIVRVTLPKLLGTDSILLYKVLQSF